MRLLSAATATGRLALYARGAPLRKAAVRAVATGTSQQQPIHVYQPRAPVIEHFNDVSVAYGNKTTGELLRALLVFQLTSITPLVTHSRRLLQLSSAILGKGLTHWGLRHTFFGHFCAGENASELYPTMDRLRAAGVGAILDYAAEADVQKEQGHPAGANDPVAANAEYDANVSIFMSCIETAAARPNGFAAIKVTALGKPELLQRFSSVIVAARSLFAEVATAAANPMGEEARLPLDVFQRGLRKLGYGESDEKVAELFARLDGDRDGYIDYAEWADHAAFDEEAAPHFAALYDRAKGRVGPPLLTPAERADYDAMMRRLGKLAAYADANRVRLMVDAEHTYLQPAIDHLTLTMQRRFNARGFPTIYNTYQAYLRDSAQRARVDLIRAKREGWILAVKVVRGAYMIQERRLAAEEGYPDPIHPDIESTHRNFDGIIDLLLENKQYTDFMVASHNENSTLHTIRRMAELGISPHDGVFFGQLLGMCDHISYTLASKGYAVYKYVPYGPIDEVLPYLIRRAEENSTMLAGAARERRMLRAELFNRVRAAFTPKARQASLVVHK